MRERALIRPLSNCLGQGLAGSAMAQAASSAEHLPVIEKDSCELRSQRDR
jgi:hypothetical protein